MYENIGANTPDLVAVKKIAISIQWTDWDQRENYPIKYSSTKISTHARTPLQYFMP
jgi:hypothetical protein